MTITAFPSPGSSPPPSSATVTLVGRRRHGGLVVVNRVRLSGPPPTPPVSINAVAGRGWRAFRDATRPWRTAVGVALRPLGLAALNTLDKPIIVTVAFAVKSRRVDPHNYTATVVKGVVDGIVAAGVVQDDTAAWVIVNDPAIVSEGEPDDYVDRHTYVVAIDLPDPMILSALPVSMSLATPREGEPLWS